MRKPGAVPFLCMLACRPTDSFALRPTSKPHVRPVPAARLRLNRRGGCVRTRPGSGAGVVLVEEGTLRTRNRHGACSRRRGSWFPATTGAAAAERSEGAAAVPGALLFESSEAVSCFRHAGTGSEIWLVGCYHRGKPSVELVENVIATVKPRVVMVELDAHRVKLLPEGEAHESKDGLCWWTPHQSNIEGPKAETRRRSTAGERGEQGVEFHTAAVAAQACGAKVLLGDRDLEDILRRQAEARSADEKQAATETKGNDKRRRAGLDMEKLEGLIARRSALGQEVPVTREIMRKWSAAMKRLRPREHAANVTERDEVMAKNLMEFGGTATTVAVVGFGHLDGIENILKAESWQPLRG